MPLRDKSRGCSKCDYTGFAYGKIPCVCRDKSLQITEVQPMQTDTPYGTIPFVFTSKAPEIKAGDRVAIGDIVIGTALSPADAGGVVTVAIRGYCEWIDPKTNEKHSMGVTAQVNARDLVVVKSDHE